MPRNNHYRLRPERFKSKNDEVLDDLADALSEHGNNPQPGTKVVATFIAQRGGDWEMHLRYLTEILSPPVEEVVPERTEAPARRNP